MDDAGAMWDAESASQLTPLSDLALSVVVELLQAARKQQLCSTSCGASDPHLLHPWADQLLAAAMQPPLCLVQPSVNADAQNEVADLTFQQQLPDEGSALQPSVQQSVKLWQIQLLGSLAAFPPDHTPLTAGQQEAVLTVLLAQLSNDGSGAGVACAQAASVALQQMAGEFAQPVSRHLSSKMLMASDSHFPTEVARSVRCCCPGSAASQTSVAELASSGGMATCS